MQKEDSIRLSKFCHTFRRHDVTAFVHSVNLGVLYLPSEVAEKLRYALSGPLIGREGLNDLIGDETTQVLLEEDLLVMNQNDDDALLMATKDRLKQDISLELLYLLITDNCNLRCRYCFEETPVGRAGDFRPATMTREIAKRALELFGRLVTVYGDPDKTKVIHLYGGEPLLNPDVATFTIEHAHALKTASLLPENTQIAIVTNGTCVTEEIASFLAKNHVTVGLSIDGPRAVNNLYRIGKKRSLDAYDSAIKAFDLLKTHGVTVGISATLTPESVEQFDRMLDFFTERLAGADGFSLNIMHFNHGVTPSPDYYRKAAKCQIAAFELFRSKGVFEERMMRKVRSFVDRKTMYADCGVIGNQLVVAPDGLIGVCQDFVKPRTYFEGDVRDIAFDPFKSGLFKEWEGRSPLNMPECQGCAALGLCGGGCPASAELKYGSRWHIDERICEHSLETLKWLVWDTYTQLVAESVKP